MKRIETIGVMSMIDSLNNRRNFTFHGDFKNCVERWLPVELRTMIAYETTYLPLYNRLIEGNNRILPSVERQMRDAHLKSADKSFRILRRIIAAKAAEYDNDVKSGVRTLNVIMITFGDITKRAIKDKINHYRDLTAELRKHKKDVEKLDISKLISNIDEEAAKAEKMRAAVSDIIVKNKQNSIKDIKPEINAAYRNIINYLNSRRAIEKAGFAGEEFMLRWARKVQEHKNAYAPAVGSRKSRKEKKNADNGENIEVVSKKEKFYTLPQSRKIRVADVNAVKKIIADDDNTSEDITIGKPNIPNTNDIRMWSAGEDHNGMKIGDLRKTSDGRVWRLIDLGQAHRDPAGEFGHHGWVLVE